MRATRHDPPSLESLLEKAWERWNGPGYIHETWEAERSWYAHESARRPGLTHLDFLWERAENRDRRTFWWWPEVWFFHQVLLDVSSSIGDEEGQARAAAMIDELNREMDESTERLERRIGMAVRAGRAGLEAEIRQRLAWQLMNRGRFRRARAHLLRAIVIHHVAASYDNEIHALELLNILCARQGGREAQQEWINRRLRDLEREIERPWWKPCLLGQKTRSRAQVIDLASWKDSRERGQRT